MHNAAHFFCKGIPLGPTPRSLASVLYPHLLFQLRYPRAMHRTSMNRTLACKPVKKLFLKGPFTHAVFDATFVALSNATFVVSVNLRRFQCNSVPADEPCLLQFSQIATKLHEVSNMFETFAI